MLETELRLLIIQWRAAAERLRSYKGDPRDMGASEHEWSKQASIYENNARQLEALL